MLPHLGFQPEYFRVWHKADIPSAVIDVRFRGYSGHQRATIQCLLLTQSGRQRLQIAAMQTDLEPISPIAKG